MHLTECQHVQLMHWQRDLVQAHKLVSHLLICNQCRGQFLQLVRVWRDVGPLLANMTEEPKWELLRQLGDLRGELPPLPMPDPAPN